MMEQVTCCLMQRKQLQRAAVTLVNGVIYLAFASHEDFLSYHGWVLAYSAANLQQIARFELPKRWA
jgi:hypothetical protein